MAICKCKMCGGDLLPEGGARLARCEYCGTVQTLPEGDDERKLSLFNRANKLRLSCEFDKAAAVYEKLIAEFPADAEAYWGLCLCKYGIEYVDDPKTGAKVPTCHRASYEAITADSDFRAVLDRADAASRPVYERQAAQIDTLQRNILEIVKNEKPFDVFICYKETDEDGRRTPDSVLANDIYYQLTAEGLKVFYAAITLENKLGQAYEPYIFAALHSAKVMLVLGTEPEYFTSVWVKNEWSRFLKLMKTDRSKLLIPCYKNMDAYDLPEEFSHLQAQDMSKIGFMNDVIRGVKKVALKESYVPQYYAPAGANAVTAPLLKRAFLFLEDGEWQSAHEYAEKVLDADPETGEAYLVKLMAVTHTRTREALRDYPQPLEGSQNYQKAVRFGGETLKTELEAANAFIRERNENARKQEIYEKAERLYQHPSRAESFADAQTLFLRIPGYKDADALAASCPQKGSEYVYGKAVTLLQNEQYKTAAQLLRRIPGYKDADALAAQAEQKLDAEAQAQRRAAKRSRLKKLIAAALAVVITLTSFGAWHLNKHVIRPNRLYRQALQMEKDGDYMGAYRGYLQLSGFRDSDSKAKKVLPKYAQQLKNAKPGDVIVLGSYWQQRSKSKGKEPIEWIVLKNEDGMLFVISRYALDCQPYNTKSNDVSWAECSLRKWLDKTFLGDAFSTQEQNMLCSVKTYAKAHFGSVGIYSKVTLLSVEEAGSLFNDDRDRTCSATAYAKKQGASVGNGSNNRCWWWLRDAGSVSNCAAGVDNDGAIGNGGDKVTRDNVAVRPAVWIRLP